MLASCECSDEYGPCELHATTLIVREGASLHTADELSAIFLNDAVGLGAELSPYGQDVLKRVSDTLSANESMGVAWLEDGELQDELQTVSNQVETELYTLGYSVYWEDGYRIVKVTGGPLLDES